MLKVNDVLGYKQAEIITDAEITTPIKDILENYENPDMFEVFDERLICYLLAEAFVDGQVYGRSEDVLKALCFDTYYNGTQSDKELIQKQVKGILHKLYRARFIKKDREDVYLASNISLYRKYAHMPGIIQLDIESTYENGDFVINEYHCIYEGSNYANTGFYSDLSFIDVNKLGPIPYTLYLANRLGEGATVADFPYPDIIKDLESANWISILNNKVRLTGHFEVIGNADTDTYRIVYIVD
jgi:hypothetical protein